MKVKHLILGAIGCGLFENKPECIAMAWKEAIDRTAALESMAIKFAIFSPKGEEGRAYQAFTTVLTPPTSL